jgi:apolipoprotein N-acyltransferase
MLHSLLSIKDYTALGLDIIHIPDFFTLLLRFSLNMIISVLIVRGLYYPQARRKDYLFAFLMISTVVFLLCILLESVKLQLGFAFGLFAIFGILRYRTNSIPIKEMTYLFVLIGVSVVNALANKKISWAELLFTNLIIMGIIYGLEYLWLLKHESSKVIVYEKIDLIKPEKYDLLKKDLEERTGLKINRIDVGRIDFLRDTAKLVIYYYESHINFADDSDNAYSKDDDDD